jgi:hypothetical protein
MLHVGYDINDFHGFEMDSPELKIAEHVSIINKIINISIFRFPKEIKTILRHLRLLLLDLLWQIRNWRLVTKRSCQH